MYVLQNDALDKQMLMSYYRCKEMFWYAMSINYAQMRRVRRMYQSRRCHIGETRPLCHDQQVVMILMFMGRSGAREEARCTFGQDYEEFVLVDSALPSGSMSFRLECQ